MPEVLEDKLVTIAPGDGDVGKGEVATSKVSKSCTLYCDDDGCYTVCVYDCYPTPSGGWECPMD